MNRHFAAVLLSTGIFWQASSASALTTVSSGAFGVFSSVRVVSTLGIDVGPISSVSGSASPGFDVDSSVVSLGTEVDLGVLTLVRAGLGINTGVLASSASANGTLPGDTTAGAAQASVNDVDLGLFTSLFGVTTTTLGLTADTITSRSTVTRVGDTATLTGQSVFENLDLSLLGLLDFSLGANAEVVPNFVAFDLLGLTITLNEQSITGNGLTERGIITNAFHLVFDNYILGGRALTGDLIIGQSRASISIDPSVGGAVPEPGVWLQMIAGFGLVGLAVRRRRSPRLAIAHA